MYFPFYISTAVRALIPQIQIFAGAFESVQIFFVLWTDALRIFRIIRQYPYGLLVGFKTSLLTDFWVISVFPHLFDMVLD